MDMDDPAREAGRVIWEVAGASSPDKQIAAVKKYFLEDASFTYPIFDIPRRPGSRNLIIGTYLFYRNVVRSVRYDIKSVAFDELHGKLYVELVQFPNFIFLTWLLGRWKVRIHMHVHLWLEQLEVAPGESKWFIAKQEDTIMPSAVFAAFPFTATLGKIYFTLCGLMGLVNACILMPLRLWTPTEPAKRALELFTIQ